MTPSKPLPPTNNFCLYLFSVSRCFCKDLLMTPPHNPPPHLKHLSLLPPPHPGHHPSPLNILIIHQFLSYLTLKIFLFRVFLLAAEAMVLTRFSARIRGSNFRSLGRFFEIPIICLAACKSKSTHKFFQIFYRSLKVKDASKKLKKLGDHQSSLFRMGVFIDCLGHLLVK